ncbi:MAG TPA: PrpF domain-containing protein [Trebonia sp.]
MSAASRLRVVLMRGGTSKGVFVREGDLPAAGPSRDGLLLRLMGSPDPMQLDGLGGSHSSTSKVIAVSRSDRPDTDVEYLFAQVGIDQAQVDYRGNCGNLTTAVGPYAIDERLVRVSGAITPVRMLNRNTGTRIIAHVPVTDGRAATSGDCVVAGVPGTGAPVITEYLDPSGAVLGSLLPTGSPRDAVHAPRSGPVEVSLVDVAGPVAFARAADLGLDPLLDPVAANADADLLGRLEELRGACAVLAGLAADRDRARTASPALPRLALVGDGHPHRPGDFSLRVLSMQRVHHACPMTVLLCAAAAALLPGTVPHAASRPRGGRSEGGATVIVAHPKGVAAATVRMGDGTAVHSVGITRTARRLLTGEAYLS